MTTTINTELLNFFQELSLFSRNRENLEPNRIAFENEYFIYIRFRSNQKVILTGKYININETVFHDQLFLSINSLIDKGVGVSYEKPTEFSYFRINLKIPKEMMCNLFKEQGIKAEIGKFYVHMRLMSSVSIKQLTDHEIKIIVSPECIGLVAKPEFVTRMRSKKSTFPGALVMDFKRYIEKMESVGLDISFKNDSIFFFCSSLIQRWICE